MKQYASVEPPADTLGIEIEELEQKIAPTNGEVVLPLRSTSYKRLEW